MPPPPPQLAEFLRQLAANGPWPPSHDPDNATRARFDQDEAAHHREMERRQQAIEARRTEREQQMEGGRLEMVHERELANITLQRAKYIYGSKGPDREVEGEGRDRERGA
ncbi:hypothetical protein B0A48_04450 [Cryoendolithus antarcticus]|uniref:Uncharacterized protein n=1 Tax=Cryoendolithus antarcticus TaxID=1507870 RepID=A0A1V8TFE1_9PEZI|nr:hypothetical protein B0A48_04450 [Cryoendolithus antarcticus]